MNRIEVEYVEAEIDVPEEFASIFEHFKASKEAEQDEAVAATGAFEQNPIELAAHLNDLNAAATAAAAFDNDDENQPVKLSKKKLKKMMQISLAALKEYAKRPEAVEWEDVTAKDPKLLVQLKCTPNVVSVPAHWSRKRKYLAGKRGFLKPPFELPAFIKATGVGELRDAMREADAAKTTKVRARERMHPKMGRMSIDYERLHDAFFLHQTKPPLTKHGCLFYEGRDHESSLRDQKRPGFLSDELRAALGMASLTTPPPWLFAMQKFGPPPAYPHLRIPGLNAPIPEGAQWGFHPGGWGKPPVSDFTFASTHGRLQALQERTCRELLQPVERNPWGEFEPEEEEADEAQAEKPINGDAE